MLPFRMNPVTSTSYPKASKKYIQTFVRTFSDLLGQHGAHVEPAPQSQQQFSDDLLFTITDHSGQVVGTLGLWPGGVTRRIGGGRDWSFASARVQTPDYRYPASLQLKGFTAIKEPQEPEADANRLFQQLVRALHLTKTNPYRAPNARSMNDLVNAGVLEELGHDQAELIGRVSENAGGLHGNHVYLVLLHIPRKGWSVVALDDEGGEYVVAYAGIPDEALAHTAARWEYSALNGHAVDTKKARLFKKYMQDI